MRVPSIARSGTDDSPWCDAALAVEVGELPPYPGTTSGHVDDPSQRPTKADYDLALPLAREASKEGRLLRECHLPLSPFLIKDVLFSAFLVEPVGEVGLVAGDLIEALDPT